MSEYEFRSKTGSRISDEKAQVYGQRLYELMSEKNKDELTPSDVVEDAKKKRSVYHDYFVWDDSAAGEQYRLQQARGILNGIVKVKIVNVEDEPVVLRAFHCVNVGDNGDSHRAYVPEEVVFESVDFSAQVIDDALREAESWNRRYRTYSELAEISKAIERTLNKVKAVAK